MSRKSERPLFGVTGSTWREWERRRLRHRAVKALALAPRGGAAGDGLSLQSMSVSLTVEWYARDVHPWDGDLSAEQKAERFAAGLMADTVVAIRRIFERLPDIDVIQIRVREPNAPHLTVLDGTVYREDLRAARSCPSPAMSLKLLGIQYCAADGCL